MVIHYLQQKDVRGEFDGHDLHFILVQRVTLCIRKTNGFGLSNAMIGKTLV
jgi:hypothetical protein